MSLTGALRPTEVKIMGESCHVCVKHSGHKILGLLRVCKCGDLLAPTLCQTYRLSM